MISQKDFVKQYQHLRLTTRHTDKGIAEVMGMTSSALNKAIQRARAKGYDIGAGQQAKPVVTEVRDTRSLRTRLADTFAPYAPKSEKWKNYAECAVAEADSERFFPSKKADPRARPCRMVTDEFCSNCPVKMECLITGLSDPENVGIWGGMVFPQQIKEIDQEQLLKEINALER